jgi:hypothetical protein
MISGGFFFGTQATYWDIKGPSFPNKNRPIDLGTGRQAHILSFFSQKDLDKNGG